MRHRRTIDIWADWKALGALSGNDPRWPGRWSHRVCSEETLADPDGVWLARFRAQAQEYGFDVVLADGELFVLGPE